MAVLKRASLPKGSTYTFSYSAAPCLLLGCVVFPCKWIFISTLGGGGAWFGLLALLVIPIGAVIAVAYLAYGKKTTETAYMVSPEGSKPGPYAGPPPSPVVPFYPSV